MLVNEKPKKTTAKTNMAQRLKKLRKEILRLSQQKMANSLLIAQSNYSKVERGERSLTIKQLTRLRETYSININWLLTGDGRMFQYSNGDDKKNSIIYENIGEEIKELILLVPELKETFENVIRTVKGEHPIESPEE
ncbi:MAG: helix-turn-helix domain-containing protein [Spirochaetota bacterium]|nr:helix-turn-helix domain-containing protein [Spirochaetota bacterium]